MAGLGDAAMSALERESSHATEPPAAPPREGSSEARSRPAVWIMVVAEASPNTRTLPGAAATVAPPLEAMPMMAVRTPGRSLTSARSAKERVTPVSSPRVAGGPTVTLTGTPFGVGSGVGSFSDEPGTLITLVEA